MQIISEQVAQLIEIHSKVKNDEYMYSIHNIYYIHT